jgi:hypothetical protein
MDVVVAAEDAARLEVVRRAGTRRKNNHWKPTMGRFRHFIAGATETGFLHPCCTYTSRWSCRFSPTPGYDGSMAASGNGYQVHIGTMLRPHRIGKDPVC